MAKVLEGPGMGLMKKWGINVPNYVVVTSVDELTRPVSYTHLDVYKRQVYPLYDSR